MHFSWSLLCSYKRLRLIIPINSLFCSNAGSLRCVNTEYITKYTLVLIHHGLHGFALLNPLMLNRCFNLGEEETCSEGYRIRSWLTEQCWASIGREKHSSLWCWGQVFCWPRRVCQLNVNMLLWGMCWKEPLLWVVISWSMVGVSLGGDSLQYRSE